MNEKFISISEKQFEIIMTKLIKFDEMLEKFSKMDKPFHKRWVDNEKVKELLHVSTRKLQQMRTDGLIRYSTFGPKKIFYKVEELERILMDSETGGHALN